MEAIEVSQETWELLLRCAEPYVDKVPDDTLRRVLQSYLAFRGEKLMENTVRSKQSHIATQASMTGDPQRRAPRERGARIMLDGEAIVAVSVSDLYEQALKVLVKKHRDKLKGILPFGTSSNRYLIAEEPRHPSGKSFVVPVEHEGFYMEAHKDYKNAVAHLRRLAEEKIGVSFDYLGR